MSCLQAVLLKFLPRATRILLVMRVNGKNVYSTLAYETLKKGIIIVKEETAVCIYTLGDFHF